MEMMWTRMHDSAHCNRRKRPWPMGVRKRNGKIVLFDRMFARWTWPSVVFIGLDANVIDTTIALQIGRGSSSRATLENYRPTLRIQLFRLFVLLIAIRRLSSDRCRQCRLVSFNCCRIEQLLYFHPFQVSILHQTLFVREPNIQSSWRTKNWKKTKMVRTEEREERTMFTVDKRWIETRITLTVPIRGAYPIRRRIVLSLFAPISVDAVPTIYNRRAVFLSMHSIVS